MPSSRKQLVAHLQQRIVGDVELVERVVGRQHEHDHEDVGRVLLGDDAVALHLLRQLRSARLRRGFCTSTCCLVEIMPSLKMMVMVKLAFEVAWLYMYSMSRTTLILLLDGSRRRYPR